MKGYKVIFEDNKPVLARLVESFDNNEIVKLTRKGGKRFMNWLVVYSDSEEDALEIASKVVRTIWAEYLA